LKSIIKYILKSIIKNIQLKLDKVKYQTNSIIFFIFNITIIVFKDLKIRDLCHIHT